MILLDLLKRLAKVSAPLAAIIALTEVMENSNGLAFLEHNHTQILIPFIAGTMFELVKELKDGAETLKKKRSSNPMSVNAGCELFIEFVTLFPHETAVWISSNPFKRFS
jgi:translation initiation factor eIF-2B subunit alpha